MRSPADDEYVAYVAARIPALKRLAYLLCGDDHRADDLVQETITKLYMRWPLPRHVDDFDRYTRKILIRVYIDETRRPWFRVRLFGEPPEDASAVDGPTEDRPAVQAALATLPAGQRTVLVLRYLCDLPISEVAELLGRSTGTIKSQTNHGLTKLRAVLAPRRATATTGRDSS